MGKCIPEHSVNKGRITGECIPEAEHNVNKGRIMGECIPEHSVNKGRIMGECIPEHSVNKGRIMGECIHKYQILFFICLTTVTQYLGIFIIVYIKPKIHDKICTLSKM